MSFDRALAEAKAQPGEQHALEELASEALQHGEEESALPLLGEAVRARPNARLLQWKALMERALDRHEEALRTFHAAAAMAPSDAGIAHGYARTALEAGLPAEHLYEHALQLAPRDGQLLAGLAAARLAAGNGDIAERDLAAAAARAPGFVEGHMRLAELRSMLGIRDKITQSLDAALAEQPSNVNLWFALFDLHIKRERFEDLDSSIARARKVGIADNLLIPYAAVAAGELGRAAEADRLFARWNGGSEGIWRIRHLLRSGRADEALAPIDAELAGSRASETWPYALLAWRLTGDARSKWLGDSRAFVSVYDLRSSLPPLDGLAETLRSIHVAKGQYLDQSVRGGTQTDGPLFSRIEPEIRALRQAVVNAVEDYVAKLPPAVPGHPLLGRSRRAPVRFAGSWSVWLRGGGYHESHVHPRGWISSALYVSVPHSSEANGGWLSLGNAPTSLISSDQPGQLVEPRPGRLVLFPSWLWHGTVPFVQGDRLTVAFDVRPPH